MITIIGTGMSNYKLDSVIDKINKIKHEYIALHKNYIDNNPDILKGKKKLLIGNSFGEAKTKIKNILCKNKEANIIYFVTGSPIFYSGGIALIKYLKRELPSFNTHNNITIINNKSAKDYMLAKLRIKEAEVEAISCHGTNSIELSSFFRKRYTLIIANKNTLAVIQKLLLYLDPTDYSITIASKLGYDNEQIWKIKRIDKSIAEKTNDYMPYTLVIERHFEMDDDLYYKEDFAQDDGMITKRDKRYLLLSYLEMRANQVLWDIGAGTGSIGITAYKVYKLHTVFFEKNEKRVRDIKENIKKHRVISSAVHFGDAICEAKKECIRPHRIVIGGGGKNINQNLHILYEKLMEGGILLAIYVSLDSFLASYNILQEKNIPFEVRAFSYTNYKINKILIAEPQRLSFIIKITKE